MRRNLYFFVYPVRGSTWRWHVEQLTRYAAAFNGTRLVVIACDNRTEDADVVAKAFAPLRPAFLFAQNDPALWEVNTFLSGLKSLESVRDDEWTFYAHAKGVRHSGTLLDNIRAWTEAMYYLNLSSMPLIESAMRRFSTIGCFRQVIPHAGSGWHFSGTFFWFKHSCLFSRNWEDIAAERHGVESYLARHIAVGDTFCLTPEGYREDLYVHRLPSDQYRPWRELAARRVSALESCATLPE